MDALSLLFEESLYTFTETEPVGISSKSEESHFFSNSK